MSGIALHRTALRPSLLCRPNNSNLKPMGVNIERKREGSVLVDTIARVAAVSVATTASNAGAIFASNYAPASASASVDVAPCSPLSMLLACGGDESLIKMW